MDNIHYNFHLSSYHNHFWLDFIIIIFKMLFKLAFVHMDLDVLKLKYIEKEVVKY